MKLGDPEKVCALLHLYHEVFEEMRRYRDMEWKVVSWTVFLMAGIVAATRAVPVQENHKPYIRTLLFVFTLAAAIYGAWHIYFIHKRLTWYRKLRRRCDRLLGFFNKSTYGQELLPKNWEYLDVRYSSGIGHLISWWGLIALTAMYALYSVVFF